ncbi:MAG TPA: cyclic nucleotide-binding domain-containing protein [Gaiellaceae bacterium]|jgi:MFS family permease|nr:cyclic nucleotide-binding domain-containing protein [Gaiellaceae bacterium]
MSRLRQLVDAVTSALRNRDVRRAELCWGAAITAEWAHFVAFGVFAYEYGGVAAVGIAGVVRLLPAALVAPFAASFGDRFPRERFLLAMALLGALALFASAAAFALDWELLVFAFAALFGLSVTLIRPALQALLPSLARTPAELIAANGATSTIEGLGTLIGPLLAGLLVALSGAGLVFGGAALALVAGAAAVSRVRVRGRIALRAAVDERGIGRGLVAGLAAVAGAPRPRLVFGLAVAQAFVRGCLNVLIVVAAYRVLDAGGEAVGYMTAAMGVGGLVGAVGAMTLGGRRLAVPFGVSLVFWGAPIAFLAPSAELPVAVVLLAVVGAANSVEDVALFTLLQRLVPDHLLARVLGLLWSLVMAGVALGSLAAPVVVDLLGARPAFVVVGSILPLLTLVTYRRLAAIDRAVAPAPELELVDRVPMFAPLSIAAKERVAARLVPLAVAPGEVVIGAGEAGDRFYIVEEGELSVSAATSPLRAGDYFGEIALLRDVPRTATVTALTETRLVALTREEFLAALTGHDAARAAGEAVAAERLARTEAEPTAAP